MHELGDSREAPLCENRLMSTSLGFRTRQLLRKDAAPAQGSCSAIGFPMSLDWYHAILAAFFIGVWLIVGQIVATDRSEVRDSLRTDP